MSETSPRQMAEEHWWYTEGIIKILFRLFLILGKYLYIQGMVHGYKHRREEK